MKNTEICFCHSFGAIYDLFFAFDLAYNRTHVMSECVNYQKPGEDTAYFHRFLAEFGDFPDALLPFFARRDTTAGFLQNCYFDRLKGKEAEAAFHDLILSLSVSDDLSENLIQYYFSVTGKEARADGIRKIAELIGKAACTDTVKNGLYAYFIDPSSIQSVLIAELKKKWEVIKALYEREEKLLCRLEKEFSRETFLARMEQVGNERNTFDDLEKLCVFFVLGSKNSLRFLPDRDTSGYLALGSDYMEAIDYFQKQSSLLPQLDSFGNALAERNRIEILNLMAANGSVTVRDLENELGLTGTNAYYHLSLMLKANMLHTRTLGRAVFYSINKKYFASIRDALKKYEE